MDEQWKKVPEFPNYEASNLGRIRTVYTKRYGHNKIMNPSVGDKGSYLTGLSNDKFKRKSFTVQRVIAITWIPQPDPEHRWIRFKDGNKLNTAVSNLYWSKEHPTKGIKNPKKGSTKRKNLSSPSSVSKSQFTPPSDPDVEEWRQIPHMDGYDVSSFGRFRSHTRKGDRILKAHANCNGYISFRGSMAHRLVAHAFCPRHSDDLNIVNHKDFVRDNNHFSNLEWTTPSGNTRHAFSEGVVNVSPENKGLRYTRPGLEEIKSLKEGGHTTEEVCHHLYTTPEIVSATERGMAWVDQTPQNLPGEKWKKASGLAVKVSNQGRVKTVKGRILSLHTNDSGYLSPSLPVGDGSYRAIRVHRLVLDAFGVRPPTEEHTMVNHVNSVRDDNRLDNLEWVTPSQNLKHAWESGGMRFVPSTKIFDNPHHIAVEGEEFRKVGNADDYWVSNLGRVVSCYGSEVTELERVPGSKPKVRIRGKHLCLTTLVAKAFLEDTPDNHVAQPINGDWGDARAENLRWAEHRQVSGAGVARTAPTPYKDRKTSSGVKNKLRSPEALAIVRLAAEGKISYAEAGRRTGTVHSSISKAVKRIKKTC